VNLLHIESRPSKQTVGEYDFFVSCDNTKGGLSESINDLKKIAASLTILSRNAEDSKEYGEFLTELV
jgi:phenylalanine-4-hydroxylase